MRLLHVDRTIQTGEEVEVIFTPSFVFLTVMSFELGNRMNFKPTRRAGKGVPFRAQSPDLPRFVHDRRFFTRRRTSDDCYLFDGLIHPCTSTIKLQNDHAP